MPQLSGFRSGYSLAVRGHPVLSATVAPGGDGGVGWRREERGLWQLLQAPGVQGPLSFSIEVGISAVASMVGPAMIGPFRITEWLIVSEISVSGAGAWSVARLDFSPGPFLQTPVFSATTLPTGLIPDGQSLWGRGAIGAGVSALGTLLSQGWFRLIGAAGIIGMVGPFSCDLVIMESLVFPKLYVQSEAAGTGKFQVFCRTASLVPVKVHAAA